MFQPNRLFQRYLTAPITTVRYLPEWFPGASFNRFARIAKEKFNYSVNLSFQHVKESFEVFGSSLLLLIRASYRNKFQAGTLTTPSIVATCLEELPELAKRGVDEDVIRGMSGTVYLGEYHHRVTTEERHSASSPCI